MLPSVQEVNRRGGKVPVQSSGPDVLSTRERPCIFALFRSFLLPLKTKLEPAFQAGLGAVRRLSTV